MKYCNQCPRHCQIDRSKNVGFCGSDAKMKIAKVMLHEWEEPILAEKYSGAIFFSNCPLKCIFCQNYEISQEGVGQYATVDDLVEIMKDLVEKGAENIDLVSPTQYTDLIIKALKKYKPPVPVVWNSNGYEDVDKLENLRELVDVFLPDFKYSDNALALEYSKCADYFEKASLAMLKYRELVPVDVYEGEKLKQGLIVRHLVLPTHFNNTKNILLWIKNNLGVDTTISIMCQYTPYYLAKPHKILSNNINIDEYRQVSSLVFDLGFENGFLQELDSSDEKFIPKFIEDINA